ncbi:TetR/AcrR family transcriptional regulator [Pseudanabaena sp. FACHB-2040]|uniref:TetR/AcrR family transcriptional regulator n=1 Tax=Pseudanabaena sp. FACHB-2040 TaxID=2692859 RepID=UPI00168952F3|nr:TetR/AcrR family transcriptional regulator [Pseudanabaena sp. FACHB-2040]MBD2260037.1 TetR/AcrR family transcriptional regulator [Pseudanabaena sp. FACHB-2040]
MPKDTYVPCLLELFRQNGYDGATLSKISEATGLGKASLYHHFPGGKDEMVTVVLDYLQQGLKQHILQGMDSDEEPLVRLQRMCDRTATAYDNGNRPCLLATLLLGSARDAFQAQVQALLVMWRDAIATVLTEAGLDSQAAQERAEAALISIQGSLVLSQGLNDPSPFQRVIQRLPQELCREL